MLVYEVGLCVAWFSKICQTTMQGMEPSVELPPLVEIVPWFGFNQGAVDQLTRA